MSNGSEHGHAATAAGGVSSDYHHHHLTAPLPPGATQASENNNGSSCSSVLRTITPPRTSSLPNSSHPPATPTTTTPMGQTFSRVTTYPGSSTPAGPPPSPSTTPSASAARGFAAVASGLKFKRAFAGGIGKRKKSDATDTAGAPGRVAMDRSMSSQDAHYYQQQQQNQYSRQIHATPSSASSPAQLMRGGYQQYSAGTGHSNVHQPTNNDSRFVAQGAYSDASQLQHIHQPQPQQYQSTAKHHLTQLATHVFGPRKFSGSKSPARSQQATPVTEHPPPPPLPPKQHVMGSKSSTGRLRPSPSEIMIANDNRSSIIPISPGISSAVTYLRGLEAERESAEGSSRQGRGTQQGQQREVFPSLGAKSIQSTVPSTSSPPLPPLPTLRVEQPRPKKEQEVRYEDGAAADNKPRAEPAEPSGAPVVVAPHTFSEHQPNTHRCSVDDTTDRNNNIKPEQKDSWRKSDSTMSSHRTVRAGPSRPQSVAESLVSNHTIMQTAVSSRRQSMLVDDLPEEESDGTTSESEERDTRESSDMEGGGSSLTTDLTSVSMSNDTSDEKDVKLEEVEKSNQSETTFGETQTKTSKRRSKSLNITTPAHVSLSAREQLPVTPASASAAELTFSSSRSSQRQPDTQSTAQPLHPPVVSFAEKPTPPTPPSSSHLQAPSSASSSRSNSPAPVPIKHPREAPSNPYTTFPPPPEPTSPSTGGGGIPGVRLRPLKIAASPSDTRPMSRFDRTLPALPHQSPLPSPQSTKPPTTRQPAVSMSSAVTKWAVKMFGGSPSSHGHASGSPSPVSSSHGHGHTHTLSGPGALSGSGYPTGLSSGAPSSYPRVPQRSHHGHRYHQGNSTSSFGGAEESVRTSSDSYHSTSGGVGGYFRKIGHGHSSKHHHHPAGAPSVSSLTSSSSAAGHSGASDSEAAGSGAESGMEGPNLGKRLRGPVVPGKKGFVFGRNLGSVVRDTAVGVGASQREWQGRRRGVGRGERKETREDNSEDRIERTYTKEEDRRRTRGRKYSVKKGQLAALEERKLPAIVVRCAQHLLTWGVQEEGLFRIPGRNLHVTKLRAEFDSGADFDMIESSPGDLDPHAVASVFKAFLRELPEPILTTALLPYFEAAMTQENVAHDAAHTSASPGHMDNHATGFGGLPTGPRNVTSPAATRKTSMPPSLTAPPMGSLKPSRPLINAFRMLLAQLPEENRDLARTVTELIKATARESKETKMPLSNLLLVFCPSLNMNPPLLRLLCEAEGIWDEPPVRPQTAAAEPDEVMPIEDVVLDISRDVSEDEAEGGEDEERESLLSESMGRTSEDIPSSVEYQASTEDLSRPQRDTIMAASPYRERTRRASLDDGMSYQSTLEDQDNQGKNNSDVYSQSASPQPLTSSNESLVTPATPLDHSPHVRDEDGPKTAKPMSFSSPAIADSTPMSLQPNEARRQRPLISSPILIPGGAVKFPSLVPASIPPSPVKLDKRRSIPVLSLPNLSLINAMSDIPESLSSTADHLKRSKKPSLQLLFSKNSSSPLSSPRKLSAGTGSIRPVISNPYPIDPHSPMASDSSISTPLSAVTAPQSSTPNLPPKLETTIENSSLRFSKELGIRIVPYLPGENKERDDSEGNTKGTGTTGGQLVLAAPVSSLSEIAPIGSTLIADRYNRSASPYPSVPLPASLSQTSLASTSGQDDSEDYSTPALATSHLRPFPTRSRMTSTLSQASSNHLGLLDDGPEEGWTQSVLLAADLNSNGGGRPVVEQSA